MSTTGAVGRRRAHLADPASVDVRPRAFIPGPTFVSVVAVTAGAALRVEDAFSRPSVWQDEALVALNIVHRGYGGLTHTLSYDQTAPVGWLWLQRTMVLVFGNNVPALRALPVISGVAALALFAWLASRLLRPWPATFAVVLLALSPAAIRYSTEIHQYSSDLTAMAVLLLLAIARDRGVPGTRQLVAWSVAGSLAVWVSHPAVLVLAATAATLVVIAARAQDRRRVELVVGCSLGWMSSWSLFSVVSLRSLRGNAAVAAGWASALPPRPLTVGGFVGWLVRTTTGLMRNPGHLFLPVLAVAVIAAGLVGLSRHGPYPAFLLAAILGVAFVAAALRLYPLGDRLAVYLLAVLSLALGGALQEGLEIWRRRPRAGVGVAVVSVVALVAAGSVAAGAAMVAHPFTTPDTAALIEYVQRHAQPGDRFWEQWPERPSMRYHSALIGLAPTGLIEDGPTGGGCDGGDLTAGALGIGRTWVIFGFGRPVASPHERAWLVGWLSAVAPPERTVRSTGAVLYLFNFPPTSPAQLPPVPGSLSCLRLLPFAEHLATRLRAGPFGSGRLT